MEPSEKTFSSQANFHLAGLIPVAGQPLEYGMPYPDCLLPIAPDYTMIEAAVVEAAFAGCDTIWKNFKRSVWVNGNRPFLGVRSDTATKIYGREDYSALNSIQYLKRLTKYSEMS